MMTKLITFKVLGDPQGLLIICKKKTKKRTAQPLLANVSMLTHSIYIC